MPKKGSGDNFASSTKLSKKTKQKGRNKISKTIRKSARLDVETDRLKLLVLDEALAGMESEARIRNSSKNNRNETAKEHCRTASPDNTSGDDDSVDRSSDRRRPGPTGSTRNGVFRGKVAGDSDVKDSDGKVTVASATDKTTPSDHFRFILYKIARQSFFFISSMRIGDWIS